MAVPVEHVEHYACDRAGPVVKETSLG